MRLIAITKCPVIMSSGKPCNQEAQSNWGNLCIFHAEKNTAEIIKSFKNDFTIKLQRELSDNKVNELDFTNYIFPEYSFDDIEFKMSVNFTQTTFLDEVTFRRSKFQGNQNKFVKTIFRKGVNFNLSQFRGRETDFSDAQFDGEAIFFSTSFLSDVTIFNSAVFNFHCIFTNAFFLNTALFLKSIFKGKKSEFENTHFVGEKTSFFESTFESDETEFANTLFEGKISFDYCIFKNEIRFSCKQHIYGAFSYLEKLPQGINIDVASDIEYHNNINIFSVAFELSGNQRDSLLKLSDDHAYQNAITKLYLRSNARMFLGNASMREIKWRDATQVKFQHVNLSSVEFRGTDLRQIQLIDIEWNEINRKRLWFPFRSKFHALADETKVLSNKDKDRSDIELVRHAYRQLKQNYEDNRNYYIADDFYFGEMEMARMKNTKWWKRHLLSWQVLYRWASGYGQQWENSLAFLLLTLFVFPIIFMFSGLQTTGENSELNRYIQYHIAWNIPPVIDVIRDYEHALRYSVTTILPLKEVSGYKPSVFTRYLLAIEIILIPVFATLFILALRRRFKR